MDRKYNKSRIKINYIYIPTFVLTQMYLQTITNHDTARKKKNQRLREAHCKNIMKNVYLESSQIYLNEAYPDNTV